MHQCNVFFSHKIWEISSNYFIKQFFLFSFFHFYDYYYIGTFEFVPLFQTILLSVFQIAQFLLLYLHQWEIYQVNLAMEIMIFSLIFISSHLFSQHFSLKWQSPMNFWTGNKYKQWKHLHPQNPRFLHKWSERNNVA